MTTNHLHRRIVGLIGSLAAAGLLLGASIVPAAADTYVQGRGVGGVYNLGAGTGTTVNFWVGTFSTTSGDGFCIQPMRDWSGAVPIGDPAKLTSFTNDQGKALTKAQLNQLAYIMWSASSNGVNTTRAAVKYKLAAMTIAGYNHVRVNRGGSAVSAAYYNFSVDDANSDGTKIATAFDVLPQTINLVAAARARATNWDGTGTLTMTEKPSQPGDKLTAEATLPGIGSGVGVIFTVISPDGSVESATVNTAASVAQFTYTTTQWGDYTVNAKLAVNAAPRFPMVSISATNQSLLIIAGKPRKWSGSLKFTLDYPTPTIGTQISDQVVLPGQTIHDTVLLDNLVAAAGVDYTIDGGLYALPPDDSGACPGADSPDWATAPQLMSIENVAVPLEHKTPAPSNDDVTPAPDDPADDDATPPDDDMADDDTLPDDPATPQELPIDPGAPVETAVKMTMKVGEWTVPSDQPPICVSYGETITMRVNGEVKAVVEHPAGDPGQTGITLSLPTIETQIRAAEANPDDTLSDTVTIGGLDPFGRAEYHLAGHLVEVSLPSSGKCPGVGAPAWAKGKQLTAIDQLVTQDMISPDGQVVIADLGEWTTPGSKTAKCVSYAETVTITIAGHAPVVIDHPAGKPTQTAKTVPVPDKKPSIILFDTGGQIVAPIPWQPWAVGLVSVLALVAAVALGVRLAKNR